MSTRETDQQLVERAQKGDTRAFDLLVKKYQHKIIGLIGRYVHDHSEVQDVAQEHLSRPTVPWASFVQRVRFIPGCIESPSTRQKTIWFRGVGVLREVTWILLMLKSSIKAGDWQTRSHPKRPSPEISLRQPFIRRLIICRMTCEQRLRFASWMAWRMKISLRSCSARWEPFVHAFFVPVKPSMSIFVR